MYKANTLTTSIRVAQGLQKIYGAIIVCSIVIKTEMEILPLLPSF